jgi:hypothetical protein
MPWNQGHPPNTDVAESECICRAVRMLDQRRVPGSNDLHRAGIVTPRLVEYMDHYHGERTEKMDTTACIVSIRSRPLD